MTATREILLQEAFFQQSYAQSDRREEDVPTGFVGVALITENKRVAGGHALGENYAAAAQNAVRTLNAIYSAAHGEGAALQEKIVDVVLVTERNLDEIPEGALNALKSQLGLPEDHQIGLRRRRIETLDHTLA